jgi:hypothetical protein
VGNNLGKQLSSIAYIAAIDVPHAAKPFSAATLKQILREAFSVTIHGSSTPASPSGTDGNQPG